MITEAAPAIAANHAFATPVDQATVERTADALRTKGYDVHIANDLASAREIVLGLVPEGAEVGSGASQTLEELGVRTEIEESGRFEAMRPKLYAMDRETQAREMRKLGAAPDVWLNSAHALTEDGTIVIASFSGSQFAPIASGAGKVIFAIGAQKIVPDLPTALRRVEEYSLPLESARLRATYGRDSVINKILMVNGEFMPGRISVVLIPEAIGF
jgi:hypothetical protein